MITRLTIMKSEVTELLWDEILAIARNHGMNVKHCGIIYLDISDIEPDVPSYEDFREVEYK